MGKKRIAFLLILTLLLLSGCSKKEEITGGQMILAQIEFTENYFSLMDEMAETYSEYIAFNISEQKFKEIIKEYLERVKLEEKRYEEFNKKYVLSPEETDDDVLKAIALAEEARGYVKAILEKSIDRGRVIHREKLLELYTEHADKIQAVMEEFKKIIENI
jgi:hypothetical protein